MPNLTGLLSIQKGDVVTIIGSGGKTSLLWRLAAAFREENVLVTTTTKIMEPDALYINGTPRCEALSPKIAPPDDRIYTRLLHSQDLPRSGALPGVTLAGDRDERSGKLGILAEGLLESIYFFYDRVLIEGDGAARRPLKGWAAYEPVVPVCTSVTVGVLPLWPIGKRAIVVTEEYIHRLPLFCQITGAVPGESLTVEHLARVIASPQGLFCKARGRRTLLLNQVETEEDKKTARKLVSLLPEGIGCVIAGSVHNDEGERLA